LRAADVDVESGVLADDAAALNVEWTFAVTHGRPFVTWKYAATLDGRVAAEDLSARWISSSASRADAHRLRAAVDAVLVGSGTVLADDPHLTVRDADDTLADHQPLRVVLDRRHRTPQQARVLDSAAETLLLDTAAPRFALKALGDRGVRHVLLEGGPTLAGAFLEARCIDEVVAYLAPMLLGAGPSALGHAGIDSLGGAVTLELDTITRLGPDVKIVARPVWPEQSVGES
jgi:diaminohydroxyphosphoribosylaminopyrimidine deaminase/5-amino-6-(5-phosphoribosylamino)uracil reductase